MRFALRLLLPALVLLGPMQGRASAVPIQELLEFKGKLSDDVLVALIESDGSVFHLSIGDVAALKDKGLSEKVILAMLKTATKQATTPAPPPADPYGQPPQYAQEPPQPVHLRRPSGQPTGRRRSSSMSGRTTQHVDQPQQNRSRPRGYPLGYSQCGGFIGAPIVNRPVARRGLGRTASTAGSAGPRLRTAAHR
jgi:hypothetical protein